MVNETTLSTARRLVDGDGLEDVLGAWGCGVFRNDPSMIAQLFAAALRGYAGRFDRVVFTVLDTSEDKRIIGPFIEAFQTYSGSPIIGG